MKQSCTKVVSEEVKVDGSLFNYNFLHRQIFEHLTYLLNIYTFLVAKADFNNNFNGKFKFKVFGFKIFVIL